MKHEIVTGIIALLGIAVDSGLGRLEPEPDEEGTTAEGRQLQKAAQAVVYSLATLSTPFVDPIKWKSWAKRITLSRDASISIRAEIDFLAYNLAAYARGEDYGDLADQTLDVCELIEKRLLELQPRALQEIKKDLESVCRQLVALRPIELIECEVEPADDEADQSSRERVEFLIAMLREYVLLFDPGHPSFAFLQKKDLIEANGGQVPEEAITAICDLEEFLLRNAVDAARVEFLLRSIRTEAYMLELGCFD